MAKKASSSWTGVTDSTPCSGPYSDTMSKQSESKRGYDWKGEGDSTNGSSGKSDSVKISGGKG